MAEMVRIFGHLANVCFRIFRRFDYSNQSAREYNVKFNLDKLLFKQSSVQFLGLIISESEI